MWKEFSAYRKLEKNHPSYQGSQPFITCDMFPSRGLFTYFLGRFIGLFSFNNHVLKLLKKLYTYAI